MTYRGSNWRCPRCTAPFSSARAQFGGDEVCGTCGGAFISHERVTQRSPEIAAKVSAQLSSIPVDGLMCPLCADSMRRALIDTGGADVQVDYCMLHGFWFDAREYDLLRLVQSPIVA